MPKHAQFVLLAHESSDRRLVIRDTGHHDRLSVTNDAEHVVAELTERGLIGPVVDPLSGRVLPPRELFYYDSDGQLDQLLHKDGRFVGFWPGPPREVVA